VIAKRGIVVAYFLFVVVVGTYFIYRKPLHDDSNGFIHRMQAKTSASQMKSWRQFSFSGLVTFPILILLTTLDYRLRSRQVYWSLLFSLTVFIQNIMKMVYREPRPFWEDPSVFKGVCTLEYGNPSGHSMMAAVMSVTLAFEMMEFIGGDRLRHWLLAYFLLQIAMAYTFLMGLSRVVLGVHSWNQVLYGWIIGIWLAVIGHFGFRKVVMT
jgi:membrane-associated phospholipid phosphatase